MLGPVRKSEEASFAEDRPQSLPVAPATPAAPAARARAPSAAGQRAQLSPPPQRVWFTPAAVFSIAVIALLYVGMRMPTERYITPKRGLGYALGIIGGSLMLLLFLYSARKRIPWLSFLGSTTAWFRYHMVLGVLGPLCILYHANFGLGAANSNVALFCMLTVAGSGLVGRYIYSRIHHGLYGSKLTLEELNRSAEALRSSGGTFTLLPQLADRLERAEQRVRAAGPQTPLLGIARLAVISFVSVRSHWQLHGYISATLRAAARKSAAVAAQRTRLRRTAFAYVDRRLATTRRVAGFEAYERLFSLWHALHLPLIFIMLVAGIVHVVAVHVY